MPFTTREAQQCGGTDWESLKALHSLMEVARMNAGVTKVDSAVLLGESGEIAYTYIY